MIIIRNPFPVNYAGVDVLAFCCKAFLPVVFLIFSFKSIGQTEDVTTATSSRNLELVCAPSQTVAINQVEGEASDNAGTAATRQNITALATSSPRSNRVQSVKASNSLRLPGKSKFTNGRRSAVTVNAGADFTKNCLQNIEGKQIGEMATPGFTYSWSPTVGLSASDISNPIANPTITITYTLTKTNTSTGFSNTDRVHVTVDNAAVGADAGGDFMGYRITNTPVNTIGETSITGYSYVWESSPAGFNSNISNPTVSPLVSTTYTVTKTNLKSGCSSSDEVRVVLNTAGSEAQMAQKFKASAKIFVSRIIMQANE